MEAYEIFGFIAGALMVSSLIPQLLKIVRLKQATSIPQGTYFMLICSYALWLIYGMMSESFSLVFWSTIACIVSSATLLFNYINQLGR